MIPVLSFSCLLPSVARCLDVASKMPSLTLDPIEQYAALSALDKIAITADMYAMQNVTLDEQLDAVARTFKGIVTYGVCVQPNGKSLFRLGFVYGS